MPRTAVPVPENTSGSSPEYPVKSTRLSADTYRRGRRAGRGPSGAGGGECPPLRRPGTKDPLLPRRIDAQEHGAVEGAERRADHDALGLHVALPLPADVSRVEAGAAEIGHLAVLRREDEAGTPHETRVRDEDGVE